MNTRQEAIDKINEFLGSLSLDSKEMDKFLLWLENEINSEMYHDMIRHIDALQEDVMRQANDFIAYVKGLKDSDLYLQENDYGDDPYLSLFAGTVFSIMPSGKFYTPWACSNVDLLEAASDENWREQVDRALDDLGYWLESGEGDPCDLFVCKQVDDNEE